MNNSLYSYLVQMVRSRMFQSRTHIPGWKPNFRNRHIFLSSVRHKKSLKISHPAPLKGKRFTPHINLYAPLRNEKWDTDRGRVFFSPWPECYSFILSES